MNARFSRMTGTVIRLWNRFLVNQTALLISLLGVGVLGIWGLLANSVRQENLEFRLLLQHQVSAGLAEQTRAVGKTLTDYAAWDEFALAANREAPDWGWLTENLTPSIYGNLDIDLALLIDPARRETLYAIKYGHVMLRPQHALRLSDAAWRWIDRAMRAPRQKSWTTAMVDLDTQDGRGTSRQLYLVALHPVENERGEIPPRHGKLLLFAREFDDALLRDLSSSYLIQSPRVRFDPPQDPARMSQAVSGLDGRPVAWVDWGFTPPGDAMLARLLPGATLLCLLLFLLGWLLGQQARRLQRAQADTLSRLRRQGETLRAIVERADAGTPGSAALQDLCRQIGTTLRADWVSLWRYEADRGALAGLASYPRAADGREREAPAVYLQALERSRYLVLPEPGATERGAPPDLAPPGAAETGSRLDATVRVGKLLQGLFSVGCVRPRTWTPDEINFLCSAADALALLTESSARQTAEGELAQLFYYDRTTGLPNGQKLRQHLDAVTAPSHPGAGACVLLALDNLAAVAGAYGVAAGERLIDELAGRLDREARPGEMAARLDEARFGLWLAGQGEEALSVRLTRLQQRLSAPLSIGGLTLHPRVRIGVSLFPGDGEDADTLLQQAGSALQHAARLGRPAWVRFNRGLGEAMRQQQRLQLALREARARQQLHVHYQPFVDLSSGRILGAEALLRWTHPELGPVPPATFIPLAEEDDALIHALGAWVLDQACAQVAHWRQCCAPALFIAVNVSVRQMETAGFHLVVADALRRHGLPAGAIELELTESIAASGAPELEQNLRALREMGVALAIDDFGTGYASFGYLRRFPVGRLKIDRQFLEGVPEDPQRSNLVRMIVTMAHVLGAHVIGEGVETAAQAAFLREIGGDLAQGYFFCRPLPPDALETLLAGAPLRLP